VFAAAATALALAAAPGSYTAGRLEAGAERTW